MSRSRSISSDWIGHLDPIDPDSPRRGARHFVCLYGRGGEPRLGLHITRKTIASMLFQWQPNFIREGLGLARRPEALFDPMPHRVAFDAFMALARRDPMAAAIKLREAFDELVTPRPLRTVRGTPKGLLSLLDAVATVIGSCQCPCPVSERDWDKKAAQLSAGAGKLPAVVVHLAIWHRPTRSKALHVDGKVHHMPMPLRPAAEGPGSSHEAMAALEKLRRFYAKAAGDLGLGEAEVEAALAELLSKRS